MYTPNSNYLVEGGSKLSFWTCPSLSAARTKKKLLVYCKIASLKWPYKFRVLFIQPLSAQEFVGSFRSNNGYHLCSVVSGEFIMPKVAFLICLDFFHDFVSASSNGVDYIIYGSNPARDFSVYYMDLVHTISPVIK